VRVFAASLLCSLTTCGPESPDPATDGGEGTRHVVQAKLVAEFSDDGCETFGTYTVALVRADP
jgi:hypothetical protein